MQNIEEHRVERKSSRATRANHPQ